MAMPSQFLSYPNEIAARNASKAALNRMGELHAGNTTQYLWPWFESADGNWYMEITDDSSMAKYRNVSLEAADIARLSAVAPIRRNVEVL